MKRRHKSKKAEILVYVLVVVAVVTTVLVATIGVISSYQKSLINAQEELAKAVYDEVEYCS